jgi:small GTP-binding protein
VGKSAFVVQFCKGKFVERFDPTIEDAYRQQCDVDGNSVMLEIYDTAGQEEFSSLRDTYIKASEGFLLVYSITAMRTFQHAQKLLSHIQKMKSPDVPLVMIGNKKDMEDQREVKSAEAEQFATSQGVRWVEASAKTCENVHEAIHSLVRLITAYRLKSDGGTKPREKKGCVLL